MVFHRAFCVRAVIWLTASAFPAVCVGAAWYVSPQGRADNSGSAQAPWDIASALGGRQEISPGDTVFLQPGTYGRGPKADYEVRLVGTAEQPIHVRSMPGARATIDGGLVVHDPSAHVWIRDLEILVSENQTLPREIDEPGSHPQSYNRRWGGLQTYGGRDCKYINLVIHDCAQGVSSWVGAQDIEIYGCLIYDNGWKAPDRGHGHCIYTQNRDGIKTIRHCILSAKYEGSYTLHAYGSSRAYVDNYLVEENIAFEKGPFLIGGGRPSRNIRVLGNVLGDVNLRVGYSAPYNENCEVRGNVIVGGGLDVLRYRTVVKEDNLVLSSGEKPSAETLARWFPNAFDPNRAHLAVVNGTGQGNVEVDAQPFLAPGNRYRLMDPKDFYGKPVQEGTCEGTTITVPLEGTFAALVVLKDP